VYARRRILAILVVLILLALVLPRACQALMGSDDAAGGGLGGEPQAGAAGTETGTGASEGEGSGNAGADDASSSDAQSDTQKDEGAGEAKDEPSDRGAPFLDDGTDGDSGSGGDEAAPDLLALVTPLPADTGDDGSASEGGLGYKPLGGRRRTAGRRATDQRAPVRPGRVPGAGTATPVRGEQAPTRRAGPAEAAPVVELDASSRSERIRARAERLAAARVAEPAALDGSGSGHIAVEPAATETFGPAPVASGPVATAPVATAPVPAAVSGGPTFAQAPAGGALNNAGAVPAALPASPRLAGPAPTGAPGPAF
jgi:hypothetical protein